MKSVSSNKELKQKVGRRAAEFVKDGMKIGIGTGSTVAFFIEELGRRVKEEGLSIQGVTTSLGSSLLCLKYGIPLMESMHCSHLDLAVDGADEIDPYLNAIKGGGAAHTIEKIIASMADEFILIADETKLVPALCRKFPLPIEVIPASLSYVEKRIRELGGTPEIRTCPQGRPCNQRKRQLHLGCHLFHSPEDVELLDRQLQNIPGIVETGLFLGIAKKALIGYEDSVEILLPKG